MNNIGQNQQQFINEMDFIAAVYMRFLASDKRLHEDAFQDKVAGRSGREPAS